MNGGPLPPGAFNQGDRNPGRITWTNVWLLRVIQIAYDFPTDRITGPDWLNTDRFDIVGTFPADTALSDFRQMVQSLLAERFKLVVHRGIKEVSGYVLEVAKNGPKLRLSGAEPVRDLKNAKPGPNALTVVDDNGFPAPRPGNPFYAPGAGFEATIAVNGRYRASSLNSGMEAIAEMLGRAVGAPLEDRTGLTGVYNVRLEYLPNSADTAADPGPGILDAVEMQLGLKLTAKKVPVEMLVIDHAERVPTGN